MDVRDAVESDAEVLADLAGAPADVMRNVIHDRTVRVAESPESVTFSGDNESEGDGSDDGATGADPQAGDGEVTGGDSEPATPGDSTETVEDAPEVTGFLSFDVRADTVHVTQFGGDRAAFDRLLDEPVGFADREGLATEVLVTDGDDAMRGALEAAGFEDAGSGPRFGGDATTRYRRE